MPVVDTPYDLNNSTCLSRNVKQVRLDCCSAVTGGGSRCEQWSNFVMCSVTEPATILLTQFSFKYDLQAASVCSMLSSVNLPCRCLSKVTGSESMTAPYSPNSAIQKHLLTMQVQ